LTSPDARGGGSTEDLPRLGPCVAKAIDAHRVATSQRRILESARHQVTRPVSSSPVSDGMTEGTVLAGRYRVGRVLGAGGMGTVYEGRREDLADMPVAIKVLHASLCQRKDLVLRFRREAEIVAALDHPNIVRVLDFVAPPDGGPAFLVMELLRGRTLARVIEEDAPLSEQRVAKIASQVLSALASAHRVEVVHRDLKPENLLLTTVATLNDLVKLLDFGVAKLVSVPHDQRLTQTGHYLGTPAYMAPEYTRGEEATTKGDLYALGCVMYEALTGELPFGGPNYHAVLQAIQHAEPRPLRSVRPDVSDEFAQIVARAMAKDPSSRFESASAMADALAPRLRSAPPPEATVPLPLAQTVELDLSEIASSKRVARTCKR
jgi:eukaryotic-like serine/threonine-protein kinase